MLHLRFNSLLDFAHWAGDCQNSCHVDLADASTSGIFTYFIVGSCLDAKRATIGYYIEMVLQEADPLDADDEQIESKRSEFMLGIEGKLNDRLNQIRTLLTSNGLRVTPGLLTSEPPAILAVLK